jgi:hypothetical protein
MSEVISIYCEFKLFGAFLDLGVYYYTEDINSDEEVEYYTDSDDYSM